MNLFNLPKQPTSQKMSRPQSSSHQNMMNNLRRTMSENNILSEASKVMREQMKDSRQK